MKQHKRFSLFKARQRGITLIEVLIAVFISAVGVLGAAAMQLNALKYTDSSRMTSQASFIVYDIIDRIRANAGDAVLASYHIDSIAGQTATGSIQQQDLTDFATNVSNLPDGQGSIDIGSTGEVTVTVSWSEGRAGGLDDASQAKRGSFVVKTRIKPVAGGAP